MTNELTIEKHNARRWTRSLSLWMAAAALAGCGAEATEGVGEAALIGDEAQALVTCDVIQRGTSGAASDAQVARDLTDATVQTTNYGALATMDSARVGPRLDRTLLQFDLSSVPAGATVTSATITLEAQSLGNTAVQVRRLKTPWNEAAITWNTHTSLIDPTLITTFSNGGPGYSGPLSFDVTSLATGWVDGTVQNDGVLLGQTGGRTTFQSSESATVSQRPRLDICYVVADCFDGIQNGTETGIDCGGSCGPCAQPGAHIWSRGLGSAANEVVLAVAADALGNTFVAGFAEGAIDFGSGLVPNAGGKDILVAKIGPAGDVLWGKLFGGAQDEIALAIAVDPSGDIFITGGFVGTLDFGTGPLVSAGGSSDVFLAKIDTFGNAVWSKRFGNASLLDEAYGVGVDAAGAAVIGGSIGGGSLIAKVSPAGATQWVKPIVVTGGSYAAIRSVSVSPEGDVFLVGTYTGTADFGGGPLPTSHPSKYAVFGVRLDAAGNHVFTKGYPTTTLNDAYGQKGAFDSAGNAVLMGNATGAIDLGTGPVGAVETVFMAKLDATGTTLWSKGYTTLNPFYAVQGFGAAVDSGDNILLAGTLGAPVDFGGGLVGPSIGSQTSQAYVVKLDPAGGHIYSEAWGSSQSTWSRTVCAGPSDAMIFGGSYQTNPDFGGGPLTSYGSGITTDAFVVKLAP